MVKIQSKKTGKLLALIGSRGSGLKKKKNLGSLARIASQMNNLVNGSSEIPRWMTTWRMVLCHKDPTKGSAVDNYRPISCLPLMWKLRDRNVS